MLIFNANMNVLVLECSNDDDCFNSIFPLCKRIPDENYALLEELMFHLAKYAYYRFINIMC